MPHRRMCLCLPTMPSDTPLRRITTHPSNPSKPLSHLSHFYNHLPPTQPHERRHRLLEEKNNPKKSGKPIVWSEDAKKTVVLMPFLGGAMGAGHSELGNRFEYLKACFWSFYEFIPNIVAGVSRQEDVDWCMKESGHFLLLYTV